MHQFIVSGMTCGHCVQAIEKAIAGVDAAARVEVDLPSKTVRVESSSTDLLIEAAIIAAGYEVQKGSTL